MSLSRRRQHPATTGLTFCSDLGFLWVRVLLKSAYMKQRLLRHISLNPRFDNQFWCIFHQISKFYIKKKKHRGKKHLVIPYLCLGSSCLINWSEMNSLFNSVHHLFNCLPLQVCDFFSYSKNTHIKHLMLQENYFLFLVT